MSNMRYTECNNNTVGKAPRGTKTAQLKAFKRRETKIIDLLQQYEKTLQQGQCPNINQDDIKREMLMEVKKL